MSQEPWYTKAKGNCESHIVMLSETSIVVAMETVTGVNTNYNKSALNTRGSVLFSKNLMMFEMVYPSWTGCCV